MCSREPQLLVNVHRMLALYDIPLSGRILRLAMHGLYCKKGVLLGPVPAMTVHMLPDVCHLIELTVAMLHQWV